MYVRSVCLNALNFTCILIPPTHVNRKQCFPLTHTVVFFKMAAPIDRSQMGLLEVEEIRSFVCRCVETAGGAPSHASCLADVLLAADTRGHYSHGLNRLGQWSCQFCVA